MTRAFLVLLALLSCTPANARMPDPPPDVELRLVATGDSAKGAFSWTSVRGATGYLATVTVTASNGTWTGLPTNLSTPARSIAFIAISSAADSGTFVGCVRAFHASDTTAPGCTAPRQWRRRLVPPAPAWDSLIGLLVRPDPVQVYVGATRQVCAFARFANGAVAQRSQDAVPCDTIYRRVVPTGAIALVTPAQQQLADGFCVAWQSADVRYATVTTEICPAGSRWRFEARVDVVVLPALPVHFAAFPR